MADKLAVANRVAVCREVRQILQPSQFVATFRFATFWPAKHTEVAKVEVTGDARVKQQVGMSGQLRAVLGRNSIGMSHDVTVTRYFYSND